LIKSEQNYLEKLWGREMRSTTPKRVRIMRNGTVRYTSNNQVARVVPTRRTTIIENENIMATRDYEFDYKLRRRASRLECAYQL